MSKIIELKNVNKWFDKFQALKDIDLEVNQQEKIVICGPSGSGKSYIWYFCYITSISCGHLIRLKFLQKTKKK